MRSIATLRSLEQRQAHGRPQETRKHRSASFDEVNEDVERLGLAELLLDSEVVGGMVRSLVDIKTADGDATIFSVLGLGEFVLDVTPGVHTAVLTDLSSGLSIGTPLGGGYSVYSNYGTSAVDNRMPREKINVFRLVWDWVVDLVFSPGGVLASMVAGIILFLWLCVKSIHRLQRRPSR